MSLAEKRNLLDPNANLSIREQCKLLALAPSSYYYDSTSLSVEDERLMALIDEHYLQNPHEGKVKRARWLSKKVGYPVGRRRVKKLMEIMDAAGFSECEVVFKNPTNMVIVCNY